MKKMVLMAAGLLLASLARADVAATGEAIAAALNERDVQATLRLIDADAVGRAVIKDMGLSAGDRETVLRAFPNALRTNIDLGIRTIDGSKGSARYLRAGQRNGRPYALFVSAGSDGANAVRQMQRICTGLRLREVAPPFIVNLEAQTPERILAPKTVPPGQLARCAETGAALAAGLASGVF